MDISDALARLLPIAKTTNPTLFGGVVAIRNGRAECYDGRLFVSYPVPVDVNICVAAEPLAKAIKPGCKYEVGDENVVIRSGRSRITLKLLDATTVPEFPPHADMKRIPEGCLSDWARARKFASENAAHGWATSICANGEYLLSTNNVVLSQLTMAHPGPVEGLIPSFLIDYVSTRTANGEAALPPVLAGADEHAITLQWHDGSYIRAQRVLGQPHEQLFEVANQMHPAGREVKGDWRQAYAEVLPFAEATISVKGTSISASRDSLDAAGFVEDDSVLGDATLDPRYFNAVLEESTHIDLAPHPGRCRWSGVRIIGIIAGRAG